MCDERQIASEFESTAICTFDTDDTEGSADAVLAEFFLGHERGCRSTSSNRPSSSLSLPLFHSNGLFDQTPIRCDGAHIGQTFSARGSDFPSRVCVPTCLAIRPVGGRLSSLPPSSFLPAALRSRHRCRRQHHASQPGQLPHAQGGFTLRGRRH